MNIKDECKKLLQEQKINTQSKIDFDVNGEIHSLSLDEIINTYMQASNESQLVFYAALQKSIDAKEMGVQGFFEGMGKLLLMSQLSEYSLESATKV